MYTQTINEIKAWRQERKSRSSDNFDSRRFVKFRPGQRVSFTHCNHVLHGIITNVINHSGIIAYHITSGGAWYRYIDQQLITE